MKDVAKAAGVGHSTVSRVLHGSAKVDPETRARVKAAIEDLGYEPNLLARGLVTQRTQAIGLISPPPALYTHFILESVAESCRSRGYATLLCPVSTWEHEDLSFKWVDQNWRVDGIIVYSILHYETVPDEILKVQSSGVPIVFVNKFLREKRLNAVGVDNHFAVDQIIEHFASLGHQRIGILNGHRGAEDGAVRCAAFREALDKHGLTLDERFIRDAVFEDSIAHEQMTSILKQKELPTAMFCANDHMALGALRAIKDKGLRVPDDIALAGFDDIEATKYVEPSLTTFRPPLFDVGSQAVDLLMDVIKNPERAPEQRALKGELIVRESTVK